MIVEEARRIGRWCWKASMSFLALALGIAIGVFLSRLEIANLATIKALDFYGFRDIQLQWIRFDRDRFDIDGIRLSNDDQSLEIDRLSIDLDLAYILRRASGRVCIGSDSPEFSLRRLRHRFEELTSELDDDVRRKIAHGNLLELIGEGVPNGTTTQ